MASIQSLISPLPRPVRRMMYRAGYYVRNRLHLRTGITIISYPKTGRTWLRVLIGKSIVDYAGLDEALLLKTPRLTAAAHLPVTRFTHDDASLNSAQHYTTLEADKSRFRNQKVIYLARDPRDTMVSSYFQASKRVNQFDGSLSEFIRDEHLGIKKYVQFANIWHSNRAIPRDYLTVHYEDMHANAFQALRSVLDFMGAASISDELVQRAIEYGSFRNMKQLESSGQFQEDRMKPGDAGDPESYKVRKGEIGGYAEYLTVDDLAYIDRVIEEMGYPFPLKAGQATVPSPEQG